MDKIELQLSAAFLLSLLHGLIPSHWLPIVALSKSEKWSTQKLLGYSIIASLAHVIGTLFIGLILFIITKASISNNESINDISEAEWIEKIQFEKISSIILLFLGLWFLYRHYKHYHFHIHPNKNAKWVFGAIVFAMLISPCLEIVGYYVTIAPLGWSAFISISLVYSITTVFSVVLGVYIFNKGLSKIQSHKAEHNAGIISSILMILSAIFMWFG
jgi:nickel/cobalt exporter